MKAFLIPFAWLSFAWVALADPSQWGLFYARQEWEAHRQASRNIDHYNRYDPNPRSSSVNLLPLQNQLMQWAARVDEERRQRAIDQSNRAHALVEILRESRRQAEEQARLATLEKWRSLLHQAADGDIDTSYRVARLIRWGQGRLPAEQKTGDAPAIPWYRFAADRGHADAAFELASLLGSSSPAETLRYFTRAADAGRLDAVVPAAELAEEGIPGKLPPNPGEALRLCRIGVNANHPSILTYAAFLLLRQPGLAPDSIAQALAWLEKAAPHEPAAAGRLGLIQLNDQPGLPANPTQAVAFAKLALRSSPDQRDALLTLGLARFDGLGGEPVQTADALDLLRRAAQAGSLRACDALAIAFQNGLADLSPSEAEAIRWRREAARLGHVRSMLELAVRHQSGKGVEKDPGKAVQLYLDAAQRGSVPAMIELARLVVARDTAAPPDPVRVRELAAQAAQSGLPAAEELYGAMLLDGLGGPRQGPEGLRWIQSAAQNGAREAQYLLAMHRLEGQFTQQDSADALEWMRRSAEAGNADACAMMAWFHVTGTGCDANPVLARQWAVQGAELGSPMAHRVLGSYLAAGVGGPVDGPDAVTHFRSAIAGNDDPSRLQLAELLRDGLRGVPSDREAARRLFEEATRSRDADVANKARTALAQLDQPRPVSLDGLRISPPAPKPNAPSIYDSLKLRPTR